MLLYVVVNYPHMAAIRVATYTTGTAKQQLNQSICKYIKVIE